MKLGVALAFVLVGCASAAPVRAPVETRRTPEMPADLDPTIADTLVTTTGAAQCSAACMVLSLQEDAIAEVCIDDCARGHLDAECVLTGHHLHAGAYCARP